MYLCLLSVLDANARVGQQVRVAVLPLEIQSQTRVGHETGQVATALQADVTRRQRTAWRDALHNTGSRSSRRRQRLLQRAITNAVRPIHTQLIQATTRYLQHLDLQHHLRLGQIDRLDQAFDQAHGVRRIFHDEQVQLLVGKNIPAFGHSLDQGLRLLHIGISQIKAAHHQFLILLGLGGCVRVDQKTVVVELAFFQLIGRQNQPQNIFQRAVANKERDLGITPDILVEDEIQAGRARQHLENRLQ